MSITVWDPDAGSTLVALIADAEHQMSQVHSQLLSIHRPPLSGPSLPYRTGPVHMALSQANDAAEIVARAQVDLLWYRWKTEFAAGWYELAETAGQSIMQSVAGTIAYGIGVTAAPLMPYAVAAGLSLTLLEQTNPALHSQIMSIGGNLFGSAGGGGLLDDLLNHEATAPVIELVADSMDEFLAGASGMPHGVANALNQRSDAENSSSLVQAIAIAAAMVRAAGSRISGQPHAGPLFGSTPVATPVYVRETSPRDDGDGITESPSPSPAQTMADGMTAIEEAPSDIVVEEYTMEDGSTRWQVFVQGTEDWGLSSDSTGLDLGAAISNVGDGQGSAAAVIDAMEQAGVRPEDAVDLYGMSQGGQAVALVAESGEYNVEHMVTYGAPVGSTVVSEDVQHIAIETSEDLVPAIGGTYDESNATVVTVDITDDELDTIPGEHDGAIAEHSGQVYIYAAGQVDAAGDPILDDFNEGVAAAYDGVVAEESHHFEVQR